MNNIHHTIIMLSHFYFAHSHIGHTSVLVSLIDSSLYILVCIPQSKILHLSSVRYQDKISFK